MSITDDIRSYGETVNETVHELRATAEKAINLDALRSAVEPYLAQAKEYGASVTDRAEGVYSTLRNDERVTKALNTAFAVSGVVLEQVNDLIVKPVASLTGIGAKPVAPARTPAPKPAVTKPATSKPATSKPATSKPATSKPAASTRPTTARTTTAKPATAAKKAPARKTAVKRTPTA